MRKLILRVSVSIDGYLESSAHGLSLAKTRSPEGAALVAEMMSRAGAHLFGRKAFTEMASFWPSAPGSVAQSMNEKPKFVFSRQGFDPSQVSSAKGWTDARVLTGYLAEEMTALKNEPGGDLLAHGGVEFAQNLIQTGLVDELCLAVHPVAAGRGAGLFENLPKPLPLKLVDSKVFATGAMLLTYRPD